MALLTSVLSVVTAPSRPAHAANLPRGTVTILTDSDPQPLPGASEHHKFQVSCSTVSVVADGWYAALEPIGTYRGTLVFFSGGGGNFYWSKEKKGAEILLERLRSDGFRILQVRWALAWENASPGEPAGAGVACRPASIVEYLHDNEYPVPPPPAVPGICGFCIAGPSGGSAQVGYTLSHYSLDSKLDGVFPLSGPTHAAIAKGCTSERRWLQYRYDGGSIKRLDGPFGYTQASGPFAEANGPCRNALDSWVPEWEAASIDIGGGDYQHPATRVHILMGALDKTLRAHGNDYLRALGAGGSPWVGYELVPGMGHGISEFTDGRPLDEATELEHFPALTRLRNDFLLTDPTKLPACNNGFDDDGDGGIDLADGGCADAVDATEIGTAVCDNGVDEDADGRYDFSSDEFGDEGCASTADDNEKGTASQHCDDGIDNDGDGRTDFPADPGCSEPGDESPGGNGEKHPAGAQKPIVCDDGVDNDGDGKTDYLASGLGDPDCASPEGTSETATVSFLSDWTDSEGGAAAFQIGMSSPASSDVTVQYSTTAGTATAPADFTAKTATVTIPTGSAGPVTATVDVVEDPLDEADETFTVNLSIVSGPAGIGIGDGSAVGTILDDDAEPVVSVTGQSASEAVSGGQLQFTVTLAPASGRTVTVSYATSNGTAQAPGDYTTTSGVLTFTPGQTSQTVGVPIVNDTAVEPDESFTLSLSSPNGATIGQGTATGTITNDDTGGGGVTISITDKSVIEPDTGQNVAARFTVSLSATSTQTVTVRFTTAPGTAVAGTGGDYKHKTQVITFNPGVKNKTVAITVLGDVAVEPNETFFVNLTEPVNATILDPQGLGTIVNDD
jgi:hypothetical protein